MITERLFDLRDEAYASFQARLLPTVDPGRIIGVRTPALRALARELDGTDEAAAFLAEYVGWKLKNRKAKRRKRETHHIASAGIQRL